MAQGLGGVFMADTDGNIGVANVENAEKVSGLIFDISGQGSDFWTSTPGAKAASTFANAVVELNTLDDAIEGGIDAYSELTNATAANYLLNGVAYYHIKHYFNAVGGSGRLFVMFTNGTGTGFQSAMIAMQSVAKGMISQFGIWTEQALWGAGDTTYQLNLVSDLNTAAALLANDYNAPCCVVLNANSAKVGESTTIDMSKLPSLVNADSRYVAVLLGQGKNANVTAIQASLTSKAPVGTVGCILGQLASSNVAESIGWVQQHNVSSYFGDIEMGFGGNNTPYSALTSSQIDALATKGYIFLCRYAGIEGGIFFSGDSTCSDGDYRTIARNRVINKSRRAVRAALLPYVNAPIKLAPSTGTLSAAQITIFKNLVQDALNAMESAEEISGVGTVSIPSNQNILTNDTLKISYTLVPMGTSKRIEVTEGVVLNS